LRDAFLINRCLCHRYNWKYEQVWKALEEMGAGHKFCADHVLQLTAKKAYLDSWFNAETNEVTLNDAEMLALDEVHDDLRHNEKGKASCGTLQQI
jgi:hypothetical protein